MKHELFLENVIESGDLFYEQVFNIYEDEELVFTCLDENNQRYFGVCYEMRRNLKWIICTIDNDTLIKIILRELDIHYAYKVAQRIIQIIYDGDNLESNEVKYDDFPNHLFPEPGTHLQPDTDLDDYLIELGCRKFTWSLPTMNFKLASSLSKTNINTTFNYFNSQDINFSGKIEHQERYASTDNTSEYDSDILAA